MSEQTPGVINKLFNKIPAEMSVWEVKMLLEQYKIYVAMMDKISERRHQANSFFLTVNTAILTILSTSVLQNEKNETRFFLTLLAALGGIIFSFTWRELIQSYKQLNKGKFKVIHLLETRLPARLFDAEWDALNHGDGTVYRQFSRTEMIVPVLFVVLYGILIMLVLFRII
jgi:hypothetical protein